MASKKMLGPIAKALCNIIAFACRCLVFSIFGTMAAHAEPYRLSIADNISFIHSGIDQPLDLTIDADGQVRLPNVGGVVISGLTLDRAETQIENHMQDGGFFVNPSVSITMNEYAPIIVGGDVLAPGRFEYSPAMTVASALALSGGSQVRGLTRTEIARARAEGQAGLLTANLDIAVALVTLARFQAELSVPNTRLVLDTASLNRVPSPEVIKLDDILAVENRILTSKRSRVSQLLSFWDTEIDTLEAQLQNFDQRISVQMEIVETALADLRITRDLAKRGLQTSARLSIAEQREGDARNRVLELEAAKITAERAIYSAKRERVMFLAKQQSDALLGIQELNKELETATYRHQRFQDQLAALAVGGGSAFFQNNVASLNFTIQSVRENRPTGSNITLNTQILPGETLIVSMSPTFVDLGG